MKKNNITKALHYDTLFWQVTSIFSVAIGGFFLYVKSNPEPLLIIFGLFLTSIVGYLAASFRQLRHSLDNPKPHLSQWGPYLSIFFVLML